MSSFELEAYLARLYTYSTARESFLANPEKASRDVGLSDNDVESLLNIDHIGLQMAADSYAHKRAKHRQPKKSLHDMIDTWWKRRTRSR